MIDYVLYDWDGDARQLTQLYTTRSELRLIKDARLILEALKASEARVKELEAKLARELSDDELYNISS